MASVRGQSLRQMQAEQAQTLSVKLLLPALTQVVVAVAAAAAAAVFTLSLEEELFLSPHFILLSSFIIDSQ